MPTIQGGKLIFSILTAAATFWRRPDNDQITKPFRLRGQVFPGLDIVVTPMKQPSGVTKTAVAGAFLTLAAQVAHEPFLYGSLQQRITCDGEL